MHRPKNIPISLPFLSQGYVISRSSRRPRRAAPCLRDAMQENHIALFFKCLHLHFPNLAATLIE